MSNDAKPTYGPHEFNTETSLAREKNAYTRYESTLSAPTAAILPLRLGGRAVLVVQEAEGCC